MKNSDAELAAEDAAKRAVFAQIRTGIRPAVESKGANLEATMDNLAGWRDGDGTWNKGVWGDYSSAVLDANWMEFWREDRAYVIRMHPMPRSLEETHQGPIPTPNVGES